MGLKLRWKDTIDGLAQDCGNSSANVLELPKSCAEPSNYVDNIYYIVDHITMGFMTLK